MKLFKVSWVVLVLLAFSLPVFANELHLHGDDAKLIYHALILGVDTESLNPPGFEGSLIYKREVGGVICSVSFGIYPGATCDYVCVVKEELNGEAVYRALDAEPVDVQGEAHLGSKRRVKKAGLLECTQSEFLVREPEPTYHCKLNAS